MMILKQRYVSNTAIEAMEWTEVDWHEYEELDDGVSELVLEDLE